RTMDRFRTNCPRCEARLGAPSPPPPGKPLRCPRCGHSFAPVVLPQPADGLEEPPAGLSSRALLLGAGVLVVALAGLFWLLLRPGKQANPGTRAAAETQPEEATASGSNGAHSRGFGRPSDSKDSRRSAPPRTGGRYALLIGVKAYGHDKLPDLQYTENDVAELARLLRGPSAAFDGVRLLSSTRARSSPA